MEKKKEKAMEALKMKLMMETAQTPMKDTDEETDTAEIEEEDWIEHMKRSTDEAMERMKTAESNADSKHTEEWNGD